MKITPLAFDSMGTRSMATYIETKDINIIIDPSVSLAPKRYGLPPHPTEKKAMKQQLQEINKKAEKADILIITHYHYDHYNPEDIELYKNKTIYIKNPKTKINKSQTKRAEEFLEKIQGLPKEIIHSDNNEYSKGNTTIKFSPPVPHGVDDKLGYVTEVFIEDIENNLIHTSDVQGPCREEQTDYIIKENPETLIIDGPMYFNTKEAIKNLTKIIKETNVKELIIDHHLLRNTDWKEKIAEIYIEAEKKKTTKIITAAEYMKKQNNLLEARRKELWKNKTPTIQENE